MPASTAVPVAPAGTNRVPAHTVAEARTASVAPNPTISGLRPPATTTTWPPASAAVSRSASAAHAPSTSLAPVARAPRPSGRVPLGFGATLPATRRTNPPPKPLATRAEASDSVSDEPTIEVGSDYIDEASITAEAVPVEMPSAAEHDEPNWRPRSRPYARALIGTTAALLVATVAWQQLASRSGATPRTARALQPPAAQPTQEPAKPASLQPPPATAPVSIALPAQPIAPEGSPAETPKSITVTVKVVPADSVIFRAGQRLGAGEIEVKVEHDGKQRLTALHDGYAPANFAVDGSRDAVTVRLRRATKPPPAATDDTPASAQNGTASTASTSAPAAAPEVASTAQAPQVPSAPSRDAPAE